MNGMTDPGETIARYGKWPRPAVATLLACAVAGTSCSAAATGARDPAPLTGTTTIATTTSALPVESRPPPVNPPLPVQAPPGLPLPPPPAGPHPSLNESAGCGPPQGIRGPYAAAEGYVPPTQIVAGPWGALFGRDIAEVTSRFVRMELPNAGAAPMPVWVHERAAPALQRVIDNLHTEQAGGNYYRIESVSTHRSSTVPPNRYLSFHAVGAAIDVNPSANPYRRDNVLITDLPGWFVAAWTDAGWCWGGDWQTIKDPMHFSWMGPLYSEDPAPEPIPPRTTSAPFDRSLTFDTGLGPASDGAVHLIADVDRDGAPDAVRIRGGSSGGRLLIESARATHGYRSCRTNGPTAIPVAPGATLLLADYTGDGRPDLWAIDGSSDHLVVTGHTFASGYRRYIRPLHTGIAPSPGAAYLAGDHDRDGSTDLYLVRPGSPTTVEVWGGPDLDLLFRAAPTLDTASGWHFALGDRDGDGVPDLFAFGPGSLLHVVDGSGSFSNPPENIGTGIIGHDGPLQTGDLDGDGRDDLLFVDTDGRLTVYLGGDRGDTPESDLLAWFLQGDDEAWSAWEPCRARPGESQMR